jgi:hypothetical protein
MYDRYKYLSYVCVFETNKNMYEYMCLYTYVSILRYLRELCQ